MSVDEASVNLSSQFNKIPTDLSLTFEQMVTALNRCEPQVSVQNIEPIKRGVVELFIRSTLCHRFHTSIKIILIPHKWQSYISDLVASFLPTVPSQLLTQVVRRGILQKLAIFNVSSWLMSVEALYYLSTQISLIEKPKHRLGRVWPTNTSVGEATGKVKGHRLWRRSVCCDTRRCVLSDWHVQQCRFLL